MKIDLTNLFNSTLDRVIIDYRLDLSNLIYSTYNPIKNDVTIKGSVFTKADIVYLDVDISFDFFGYCDRCAEEIEKEFLLKVKRILIESLENEDDYDNDEYVIVKNKELDLDSLVSEEVMLELPSKLLCKEDCKGLCPKCGTNLNVKKCDCKSDVDPRMEALLQLLDDEE